VQQLSQTAATDAPPLPADAAEVLVDEAGDRAGMAIYETLPEVPPPPATPNGTAMAAASSPAAPTPGRPASNVIAPPLQFPPQASARTQSPPPKPLLV